MEVDQPRRVRWAVRSLGWRMVPGIERLRVLGLIEGTSLLVLLFVAMPLKYGAGWPEAVRWVGWIHGLLFLVLIVDLAWVHFRYGWPIRRSAGILLAALLPFGPFLINGRMLGYVREGRVRS